MADQMKGERLVHEPEQPLVSVLTPAYNSVKYIEETIQSVLQQDYPHIEHIVVDGGSTDGTVEVLRRYPHLRWISEPDRGQSDALNKAFSRARGAIIGWLNADDLYEPRAVAEIVAHFGRHQDAKVLYGNCTVFNSDGFDTEYWHGPHDRVKLYKPWKGFHGAFQPAIFYRREVIQHLGGWDTDLHYVMDYDLLLRASEFYSLEYVDVDIARFRRHDEQKGALPWHTFVAEKRIAVERYWATKNMYRYWTYRFQIRHFYGLSLLEPILTTRSHDTDEDFSQLVAALCIAPTLLIYSWVRRRLIKEWLGPDLTDKIKQMVKYIGATSG